MNLLTQADSMVLEQGLYMLPAAERSHAAHTIDRAYIVEARATRVTVDRTLHVRRLELAALHDNGAGGGDGALRNIERVVVVFREAKDYCDVGFPGGDADLCHFW